MRAWRWIAALALLAPVASSAQDADTAQRTAQEQEAKKKLDAVRVEIKSLVAQAQAMAGERSDAERTLRDKELALGVVAKELHSLDERVAGQQAKFDGLQQQRAELEAALKTQHDALAALLRSAYALGRNEELKLLLQQDDVAAIARVLAYHRYFQRAQVDRIDHLRGDLRQLADVQEAIGAATRELAATREARTAEAANLETERRERAALVESIDARLKDQSTRIAALGKNETALTALIDTLRDVFADIPKQLSGDAPFAASRGRLTWPLKGKVVVAFGAGDESGRRSSGLLLAAKSGTPVRAISHGRVAFADWLRGYGLMIIVDHGDGYLSLYGCNETLLKDVGDWVDAGETIASSGASGGQKTAGLYFELRAKGQAVDPRGWLQ
ncbi:MAG: peptidoglycan DD-metalloendopeptidase family protein [Dokdonella sp.]|uniref:murein hydrolase activator EnvC family protein n=1 Tax=Dokdonella sp. TaxID=2291710 RepID=UPI00326554EE